MRVKPPQKDKEVSQPTREEPAPLPAPRRRWPLPLRILRGFASSLSGGMLLVGIIVGVGLWRSGEQFVDGIKMALTPTQEEEVDVRTVVVQQIKGASDLTTAVFTMETVVPATSTRTIANYEIGKTTLIYIARGEVRAGIDLSEIDSGDVQVNGEVLRIALPAPTIVDSKIDVSQSKVYEYDRGFLGLGPDRATVLQDQAQEAALERVLVAACEQGILQEASDRAELAVGQLLQTTGFERVDVEARPSSDTLCATAGTTRVE